MRQVMVRYTLKPGRDVENIEKIERVFAALDEASPAGLEYATVQLDGTLTFVHIARIEGDNPLNPLPAFQAFADNIGERCTEPPKVSEFTLVGNFQLFKRKD